MERDYLCPFFPLGELDRNLSGRPVEVKCDGGFTVSLINRKNGHGSSMRADANCVWVKAGHVDGHCVVKLIGVERTK